MVKEKFIQILYDTISKNPKFTTADFSIDQKKTNIRVFQTIVKITYKYDNNYYFTINIPETKSNIKKNEYSDETISDYIIMIENSPGDIELVEQTKVYGTKGTVNHLSEWLILVWDEIVSIPMNREFEKYQKTVDEFLSQMKNIPNEVFSENERIYFEKKLDDLEAKFLKNLEEQEIEKTDLESKINLLHSEIDALKQTLKVFNKKNWFRSFTSKMFNWVLNPNNQKVLKNGTEIIKGFIEIGQKT